MWAERRTVVLAAAAALLSAGTVRADNGAAKSAPDPAAAPAHFTATTSAMTPDAMPLRFDVTAWSDDAARATVIMALSGADVSKALEALPTVGYVWPKDSAVGYALKYAFRMPTADGERVTFVTARPLGAFDLKPWAAKGADRPKLDYSVIELYLDKNGHGDGTTSLAADVQLDKAHSVVSLAGGGAAAHVLAKVEQQTPSGAATKPFGV